MALALPPASQSQRPASSSVASSARTSSSARVSVGAAAAYPSVNRSANAVEQDVDRTRRFGTGGRGARGLGRRHDAAGAAQVAGPDRGPERLQVRLAGQAGVERLEAPGRAEQQPSSVAAASLLQRDLPAQVLHLGGPTGRRAARPRPRPAVPVPRRARRRRAWPWPPPAGAGHGERVRASASPRAPGTRPPRPGPRAPGRGRPSARAPRRRPRRARARPGPGARRGGRDRAPDR